MHSEYKKRQEILKQCSKAKGGADEVIEFTYIRDEVGQEKFKENYNHHRTQKALRDPESVITQEEYENNEIIKEIAIEIKDVLYVLWEKYEDDIKDCVKRSAVKAKNKIKLGISKLIK